MVWPFSRNTEETRDAGVTFKELWHGTGGDNVYVAQPMESIPAFWCAIDFISGTMSTLPLRVYPEFGESAPLNTPLARLLGVSPYPGTTSEEWRQALFVDILSEGRSIAYIERAANGVPSIIHWQIDPTAIEVKREGGVLLYTYNDGTRPVTWTGNDVIDVVWKYKRNKLDHVKPRVEHAETIKTASLLREYEQKDADSLGQPFWGLTHDTTWASMDANTLQEKVNTVINMIATARKDKKGVIGLSAGQKLEALSSGYENTQPDKTQQFVVRDVARIYGLPPLYLHDMDRQTYNNSELQGINLVKFTLNRWATKLEQELNLKILTRSRADNLICRHDFEELYRGELKTMFEAYATALHSAQVTPDEARAARGKDPRPGGDQLFIQGATVPLANANVTNLNRPNNNPDPEPEPDDET